MKRILLVILFILGIVSCGISKKVAVPNKNLSFKNDKVYYKKNTYTGKLILKKIADKEQFEEGYISLKDGLLEGATELENKEQGTYFKFTVINGNFEGKYELKHPLLGDFVMNYEKGKLKELKGKFPNEIKQDITFDTDGNINGMIEKDGEKLNFKDGFAQVENLRIKMYLDSETGQKLITEVYEGDTLIADINDEAVLLFTVKDFEEGILPVVEIK